MDISHLNKQQQLAVCSTEGKVRVIAGAGTGKTLVLVNRYAYLVNVLGIDPHNILCLTFTNKAAQEMRKRLTDMFGIDIKDSFVGTLHGFCLNFLRENYAQAGLSEGFTVMDREDGLALAKEVLEEMRGARSFVYEISNWKYSIKNDYITIINNARKQGKSDSFSNPKCQFVYRQQEMNMADYDDLLLYTHHILMSNEDICHEWSDKFDYIMVDEAQDCSIVDWNIINKLSFASGNLFVVGDPDQCIYQWRGAAPRYLVEFKSDIDVIINENYRSTQSILNVANDVISNNKLRVPKKLFSIKNEGTKPELFYIQNETKEGEKIAHLIEKEHKIVPYNKMAILYRNSSVSNHIERALISAKIPYTIWGGVRFYERREIKDILAYLRLVTSKDDLAFKRVINVPSRHLGPVSLNKIIETASEHNVCLLDALSHVELKTDKKKSLIRFEDNINKLIRLSRTDSIVDLISKIVDIFQLKEWYENDEDRIENIEELKRSAVLYMDEMKKQNKQFDLKGFLQDISLYTNVDKGSTNDTVRLMTIHQSKGLEFSSVFLCGLTDGVLPSIRTMEESGNIGMEEERRLMYVALTRAKSKLYLTFAKGFSSYGEKIISRFIGEINPKHLVLHAEFDDNDIKRTDDTTDVSNVKPNQNPTLTNASFLNNLEWTYKHGDIVKHYKYGVCEFDKYIDNLRCTIKQSAKPINVMVGDLKKVDKENYNFIKGQWVEYPGLGICKYIKDLYTLTCIVEHNGNERVVNKYKLQKVDEKSFFYYYRKYVAGDILKYDDIYGEVSKCEIGGIKLHLNNNIENDIILPVTIQGIRLVLHPSPNKTYWTNDNDKLRVFIYRRTEKDENGIMLIGEDENGHERKLRPDAFLSSKYMILKKELSLLRKVYDIISKSNVLINSNPSHFTEVNNPFLQFDTPLKGDIIRVGSKHYVYMSMENEKLVCQKISSQKQLLVIDCNKIEIVARPNNSMFYKDKTKYYYFDGFKVVGAHLQLAGVIIEREKCKPYNVDIRQICKKNMEVCSEKDFWENCKDKVGYVTYRFKIK